MDSNITLYNLLAEPGRTYVVANTACCVYINPSGEVETNRRSSHGQVVISCTPAKNVGLQVEVCSLERSESDYPNNLDKVLPLNDRDSVSKVRSYRGQGPSDQLVSKSEQMGVIQDLTGLFPVFKVISKTLLVRWPDVHSKGPSGTTWRPLFKQNKANMSLY